MKKLMQYLLAITLLSSVTIISQTTSKMYVVENSAQFLEGELIGKEVRDANGEVCAGVVIISDMQGLSFQSYNGIVKKNSEPGKDFLFVSPTERVIEIYKFGYEPLKIILNDYGIRLKSGTAWQIKITGDKKLDLIPITIMKNQTDANIYIDGELKGTENAQQVSEGKHVIRIEKTGYTQIIDTVIVTTINIYFSYELKTVQLVAVTFKSKPTDAKLIIDNIEKGITDFGEYLYPGTYKVRVVKSGYLDFEKDIEINSGQKDFTFNLIKNSSLLKLTINPTDAEIKINDKLYTSKEIELQPGKYNLEIMKVGYLPAKDAVTLNLGDTLYKSYKLSQNVAYLNLSVTPKDAKLLINKKEHPISNTLTIAPGLYQIDLSKDGYYPITESVNLELGKTISKTYALKQKLGGIRFTIKPLEANVTLLGYGATIKTWQGMNDIPDLPIGDYQLICKAEGHKAKTIDISIKENETISQSVALEVGNDFVDVAFDLQSFYDISVDGIPNGSVYNSKKLETGEHIIELSKDGESIKSVVFIDDKSSNKISIESESKGSSILLSALLPGLGQLTHDRTTMGVIYMAAFAGAAAYHYSNYKNYSDLSTELEDLKSVYNITTDATEKYNLAIKINDKHSEADDAYSKAKTSIWFPVGIYVVNLLDALFYPTPKVIKVTDNRTMELFPNFAMLPNGEINAGVLVKF